MPFIDLIKNKLMNGPASKFLRTLRFLINSLEFERISVYSSSMAFYTFVGFFPALSATMSLYFLFAQSAPTLDTDYIQLMPDQVQLFIGQQVSKLSTNRTLSLFGALISILIGLSMANMAMRSLMRGLNLCFYLQKRKNPFANYLYSISFTFLFVLALALSLSLITIPHILEILGVTLPFMAAMTRAINVVGMVSLLTVGLAAVYKYLPPHKEKRRLRSFFIGSLIATVLSVGASILLSQYLSHFGNFNRVYGTFSTIIIFMFWLQFNAISILLGARINYILWKSMGYASKTN